MKLIDHAETIVIAIAAELGPGATDRIAAETLKRAIDSRGAGHPYRRAVIVTDLAWFDTLLFHDSPTVAIGGAGVNGVTGRFGTELPTVWADGDHAFIQAALGEVPQRVTLWGMDSAATHAAVEAFIGRGWLDEFLDRCWRFRAGALA